MTWQPSLDGTLHLTFSTSLSAVATAKASLAAGRAEEAEARHHCG